MYGILFPLSRCRGQEWVRDNEHTKGVVGLEMWLWPTLLRALRCWAMLAESTHSIVIVKLLGGSRGGRKGVRHNRRWGEIMPRFQGRFQEGRYAAFPELLFSTNMDTSRMDGCVIL